LENRALGFPSGSKPDSESECGSKKAAAKIAEKTKRYPCDLTDEEWERIAPLMPKPGRRGRPREGEFREVINAVRYLVRSGCGWRMLPIHFGPLQTVYSWFRELARRFLSRRFTMWN
jgi:hypothetical protein